MSPTVQARRAIFRALHLEGCFVLPNPWDVGSAVMLQGLGFKALATTSSGHAWSLALADGSASRAALLEHLRAIVRATDLPVNADFESGFAVDPAGVAESVRMAIDTGVAGLSIEDSTGDSAEPLYPFSLAVERVRAARAAIDSSAQAGEVLLTARSEGFIRGRPDLPETLRRLTAFAEAGADCLYAPGIRSRGEIEAVVAAVSPKPVNVLAGDSTTVAELAALGVRRISVGGSLARAAWTGFLDAAREIAERGTFTSLGRAVSGSELNAKFPG